LSALPRLSGALALVLYAAAAVAPPVLAQSATGALYGVVRDENGCPLPDATVTVRGEQGEARVQDTNASGEFRFLTLEPALYHGTIELDGFSTAEYPELPIHVGRSTTIDVVLAASDSGAITVTAECPLLDERRIATGAYMTREELDKMPGARDPWALMEQAPGVLLDRVDVAGGDGVQPVVVRAAGAGIDQNAYSLDGVVITDPRSLESTPFFYDFASLEEVQVTTGGTNVRVSTPGAAINLVTRRGTNAWRASARYLQADGDWQSDHDDFDVPAAQGFFTPPVELRAVREYGAEIGGPILRDRAWAWGGVNRTAIDLDFAPAPPWFDQGGGDRSSDNAAIKLDIAVEQENRLQLFVYTNESEIDHTGTGPTRSLASALDLDAPTDIYKIEDSHVFGPELYVQAHWSKVEGELDLVPVGGDAEPLLDAAGVFTRGFLASTAESEREQMRLEISGFFGTEGQSHEMTLGAGRRSADTVTRSRWGALDTVFFTDPSQGAISTRFLFQQPAPEVTLDTNSVYVQDTLTIGNLIADVGLRYDSQKGERNAMRLAAHPLRPDLLPAVTVPGTGGALEWGSLVPRVGLTYALGERHGTLLRASWSRFADQMGASMFEDAIADPGHAPFPFAAISFFDLDGDSQSDPGEGQASIAGANGGTFLDPHLEVPTTDEVLLGAEHAGVGCFSIGGRLTWRRYQDLLDRRPFVRDPAGNVRVAGRDDYRADGIASGALPRGDAYAVPVFALRPELELLGTRRLANGDRELEYLGATVWLERRLRNRWEFRAYGNLREETAPVGPELFSIDDPTDLLGVEDNDDAPFAPESVFADQSGVFLHGRWDYTVAGLYRARAGIGLAILFHGREGYPLLYYEDVQGRDGLTRSVAVTDETDPLRFDNVHLADLRVEKDLLLLEGRAAVTVALDALNVFNLTPPTERTAQLEIQTADFVREIVAPRVLRVGVRIELR
jgi:hypothetical protein